MESCTVTWAQPQTSYRIDTFAGGGLGDGGPASQARLYFPRGVAVDSTGNLYIVDSSNHRIRKVDSTGTITTVAGTGESGFSGDGGPASQARLYFPRGVAVDSAGNLYIADRSRIRKIDSTGTITTVAGTGKYGFSGDGGPATQALLSFARGVAVDGAGNLYIADGPNYRIRKVDSTGTITTIAGMGGGGGDGGPAVLAQLGNPRGVAVDSAGNLYIAGAHRIRKIDSTGTITTVAGTGKYGFSGDGGPAVLAQLMNPRGVAVDSAGNLYIADTGNHRIRKVDAAGTITTFVGTEEYGFGGDGGPATQARLNDPFSVAVDSAGSLYIADTGNHRIRKVDSTRTITTFVGGVFFGGDGGPATQARLAAPSGAAVDSAGNLYIVDSSNHRIRKVDSTGTITTVAGTGESGFSGDGGPATQARLAAPSGAAVDSAGNLYIVDSSNHRIRKVDSTGTITTFAGTGEVGFSGDGGPAIQAQLDTPGGVAVDSTGNLYIADTGNHRIRKVDSTGTITTFAGTGEYGFDGDGGSASQARLTLPTGVGVDSTGNLYIADTGNHSIRKVDSTGTITTIAGMGELGFGGDGGPAMMAHLFTPFDVAVDSTGNLYIADNSNHRIRKVDSTGTITTIAGTGGVGFGGDGGPATQGHFYSLFGVAVDGAGNLYIADTGNHRIRLLTPTATASSLDFAHFANGTGITSSLVLVNVAPHPIRPALYFYDKGGNPIAAESVVDVLGDLEITGSGALIVQTEMEPLGELTIFTHGRGDLVDGSVKVVADGPIGGVLRFDLPSIGAAGVGASLPLTDALFPARRQAGGISTAAAIHNLGEEAMVVSCRLMEDGAVLEEVEIPLEANGQKALYIEEMFTNADTSDFMGSVRCTAPGEGMFTGVAVELDAGNRIFTTLPVVPVDRTGGTNKEAVLDFAHFANGAGITSDLVFVNVSAPRRVGPFTLAGQLVRPAIYFYDKRGNPIAAESVVDVLGDLEVTEDGALTVQTAIESLGELTISTHGRGVVVTGSVKVVTDGAIGGVLRFDLPGIGVAGVGTSQPVQDAIFPARRQEGKISTAAAIHNLGVEAMVVSCRLMKDGVVLEEVEIPLEANGQEAQYIEQMFTGTDISDFVGSVRCTALKEGAFTGMAVELDASNQIFTTLPVVLVER